MGTINSNKIATRSWSSTTMGSAAKLSYSVGDDCLIYSDINQDTSAHIVTPSSNANGALPSSYLSNSNKCIKQSDLDNYYTNKYLYVDTNIRYNSAATTANQYYIKINCNYTNPSYVSNNITFPLYIGILKNLTANVTINCYNKTIFSLRATTDCSCLLTAAPTNENNKIEGICLNGFNGLANATNSSTGTLTNTVFLSYYLKDMYKYYGGANSSYAYELIANITPEYGVIYNSPYEAQKYVPILNDVVTSVSINEISAKIEYNCVSGPNSVILNTDNVWQYTIIVSDINPTVTSSPAADIDITVDKGAISRSNSWNSTTKTLTITGNVIFSSTVETNLPIVKFTYTKTNYVTLTKNFIVNMRNVIS